MWEEGEGGDEFALSLPPHPSEPVQRLTALCLEQKEAPVGAVPVPAATRQEDASNPPRHHPPLLVPPTLVPSLPYPPEEQPVNPAGTLSEPPRRRLPSSQVEGTRWSRTVGGAQEEREWSSPGRSTRPWQQRMLRNREAR